MNKFCYVPVTIYVEHLTNFDAYVIKLNDTKITHLDTNTIVESVDALTDKIEYCIEDVLEHSKYWLLLEYTDNLLIYLKLLFDNVYEEATTPRIFIIDEDYYLISGAIRIS